MLTTRSAWAIGVGRNTIALTRLKIAVFAPMPIASERRATAVKPGRRVSERMASRRSAATSPSWTGAILRLFPEARGSGRLREREPVVVLEQDRCDRRGGFQLCEIRGRGFVPAIERHLEHRARRRRHLEVD